MTLFIFGAGGHGREVAALAAELHPDAVIEFVVDDAFPGLGDVNGFPVRTISTISAGHEDRFITAVGDPVLRQRAAVALEGLGLTAISLVHPRAVVGRTVSIGAGTVIGAGAVITENVRVGAHVIVNIGATISHDGVIGDFVTIAPGVHLTGNVTVERSAMLGAGAVVVNGTSARALTIGSNATVGAGATVIRDVDPNTTVVGVPARPIGNRA